jgi:hypothetical protein
MMSVLTRVILGESSYEDRYYGEYSPPHYERRGAGYVEIDHGKVVNHDAAYRDGVRDGERYCHDEARFFDAAMNDEASYPDYYEDDVDRLFWEAGFLGRTAPVIVDAVRYGSSPRSGISHNFRDDIDEPGVSAHHLAGMDDGTDKTFMMFNSGRPIVNIRGYLHFRHGSDGEPVIVGAETVV